MKHIKLFGGLLGTLLLASAGVQAQAPTYTIVDLGTLGGSESMAWGINNLGQVCGSAYLANGKQHPFLYSNGTMKDLGDLTDGTVPASQIASIGYGINDSGQVVGFTTAGSGSSNHLVGFLYNGTLQQFSIGGPNAINNAGQVVGVSYNAAHPSGHAALCQNGQITDLGTLAGQKQSQAYAFNSGGQIVGSSGSFLGSHAVLWQSGQIQDLGVPDGFTTTEARGINDSGQIVGYGMDANFNTHAFLWQNGQAQDLGTLGGATSVAYAVNRSGVIVGGADLPSNASTAFVYKNGQMYNLFAGTTWSNGEATAINDAGQIVGYGAHNGGFHAFLATPNSFTVSGTITLDGIVSTAPAQSVSIEFRPADGSPVMTKTVSVVANGSYFVSGVPTNVYTLSFKGAKWLRQNVENVNLNSGNVSNVNVTLPAGDANDDNRVDIGDFGLLVNAYGGDVTDPTSGYDVRADFACSGQVDVQSFGLLVNNYGSTGDL